MEGEDNKVVTDVKDDEVERILEISGGQRIFLQ